MPITVPMRKERLSEEEAFRRFNRIFDLELYALVLEYSDEFGAAISGCVKRRLDEEQEAFEAMLAGHPATLAENALRAERTQLEKERLERVAARKKEGERRRRRAAVGHLARRWGAKLALAQAG